MKKMIAATALVTIVGLTGFYQASAYWGQGMMGGGPQNCPQNRAQINAPVDAETKVKYDKFFEETQDLRKQIAVKRAVKRALMRAQTPDPVAVGKATGELFDLQNTMRVKAEAAGLQGFCGKGWCGGVCAGPGDCNGPRGMSGGPGM
ncbi:MAG: periplasmic heavy metal sensor, partial [Proteobacteria bacterium]|nr:periplasmic heavy metal sensor [Pseudomonadota bacterium]